MSDTDTSGTERDCSDCGGVQKLVDDEEYGKIWGCTDPQCGRQDLLTANNVREMLDRLQDAGISYTENVPETVEDFAKEVVEEGTFTPDCNVTADVSLTFRERLTGKREQDVTAMLILGMMLGSALERDIPKDSALEDAWKDNAFSLPIWSVDPATEQQEEQ